MLVATVVGELVGFAILGSLFRYDYLELLFVRADRRRAGIGARLVAAAEGASRSGRLFTSSNESNEPMHRLCQKLGFVRSGFVDGLDEGDPEIFYVKRV